MGTADSNATVTVNGVAAYRKGEYFHKAASYDNASSPNNSIYPPLVIRAVNGTNETTVNASVSVPGYNDGPAHDLDGNVSADSRWKYFWDGENRLIRMETQPSSSAPLRKLEFEYDWLGRRIGKKVYGLNGTSWSLLTTTKYLYDGWNLLAEVDGGNALVRSYTWGSDLSGSLQGAGSIGGLVKITTHQPLTTSHFPIYDGNGNVTGLVDAGNGTISAVYEYGPFGEPIRLTGAMTASNPFR